MRAYAPLLACLLVPLLFACGNSPSSRADAGTPDAGSGRMCWHPPAICDAGVQCGPPDLVCYEVESCYGRAHVGAPDLKDCATDTDCTLTDSRLRCANGYELGSNEAVALARSHVPDYDAVKARIRAILCPTLAGVCDRAYFAKDTYCAFYGPCTSRCIKGRCRVINRYGFPVF